MRNINTSNGELPYVLFEVGDNTYAINCSIVKSIERIRPVISIIDAPSYIRGVLEFKGQFTNVIDLRNLFGLDNQLEECIKKVNVKERIKDHEYWINTLEQCIIKNVPFSLTDDPTKCAFGKWFYSFETNNNALKHEIKKIETPHSNVHNTAKIVKKLVREKKNDEAIKLIEELKSTDYRKTIQLLGSLKDILTEHIRELIIFIDTEEGTIGITVDSIVNIEYLKNMQLSNVTELSTYIKSISIREKYNKNQNNHVLILDTSKLKK